jgi:hypothetical protein
MAQAQRRRLRRRHHAQRFILMARSDGKLDLWPVPTHAKKVKRCPRILAAPASAVAAGARHHRLVIKGRSIFDRKKPLAPKTLARIHAGAVKFGWPEPFLVVLRNHMAGQSVDGPLPTIAANGTHIALAQPIIVSPAISAPRPRGAAQPLPTITAGRQPGGLGRALHPQPPRRRRREPRAFDRRARADRELRRRRLCGRAVRAVPPRRGRAALGRRADADPGRQAFSTA